MPLLNNKKVNELMNESDKLYERKLYEQSINRLIEAWDYLPGNKYMFDESFLIVWGILDIAIMLQDTITMKKWVEHILLADPERVDSGEREMWAGKVYFELKEYEKAYDYISTAQKKSRGRCFFGENEKYKLLLENHQ